MYTYKQELITEKTRTELDPLLVMHKDEISVFDDIELCVDWESYYRMQDVGTIVMCTVRNPELVGYAIYFVNKHLHYSKDIFASQDVLYLHPKHRGGRVGIGLIKFSEEVLKKMGVSMILQHTKTKHDLSRLFGYLGYEPCDLSMMKRI